LPKNSHADKPAKSPDDAHTRSQASHVVLGTVGRIVRS
jgi:hypothetical protein